MKKNSKIVNYFLIGIPVLVGGYFLYKHFTKKDKIFGGSTDSGTLPSPSPSQEEFQEYIVATKRDPLNIRQSPSTTSTIVGSLAKNSVVKAKPYDSNWSILESGNYVSSQYLIKK